MRFDYIKVARRVLSSEVEGLQALSESLDENFLALVQLLQNLKGRAIVSGMGKSGHVARKMAATFASTGCAALFVHPGEASHGDLGMITKDDVVIILSNSGETLEIKDLINYCKRFAITLVAIVRNKNSTLADVADIKLVLPAISEASDIAVPTTSTIMMMALGDALAIVMLEKKGFSQENYKLFHPGGKLGSVLVKVEDIMHKSEAVPLIKAGSLMWEAIITMTEKRLGCVGVIDEEKKLIGIITDGDLRRHMSSDLTSQHVEQVMSCKPKTIQKNILVVEALKILNEKSITSLFVVEDQIPCGIIHIHDCLRIGTK